MALRPVVVTGLGIICAAGRDPADFWLRLTSGSGGLTPVRDEAYAVFEARHAGQVPDEWITSQLPDADASLDRTAQLALVAARQAMAGLTAADPGRFGIILGKCQATPDQAGRYQPMHRTGDVVAERLGLRGPRILVSTACAAGGNAVGLAKDKILAGEADAVLAGGVDPLLFGTYAGFAGLQALSTGPCRPYSRSDGLNLGEGAAFLLLEPLDLALARGAVPLAEVAGYGLSADAYHATAPDPTGRGGAAAMRRALADAGLSPGDVHYVSGHGTGTPANDAMEAKVMRLVFGERAGQVPTSSIKSFLGHTLGAAGAVEAVAAVLALRHGVAPPTIGFDGEPAATDLDFVPNVARPMDIETVVSNNYAFGGNNVSLVLTRPRGPRAYEDPPRREAVITGLGPVTGAGTGIAEVSAAISAGVRAAGRPPSLDGRTYAPRSLWRHMNRLSRMAIAASRLAWEDAGLKLPRKALDDVGLIFATGAGSAESTGGFDESIALNPNKPAVLSFSNVVLNATGGAVCQTLGLRGPTTTICNGGASASIALDCALELISAGKAEVVLVVAADERPGEAFGDPSDPPTPYEKGAAEPVPGSAAVAFVVESADHCAGRGGRAYARVLATTHATHDPTDAHVPAGARTAESLSSPTEAVGAGGATSVATAELAVSAKSPDSGTSPISSTSAMGGVARGLGLRAGVVVGVGAGSSRDREEAAAVLGAAGGVLTSSAALIGDCQAASGAMNIAMAALAVRDGIAPALTGLARPVAGDLGRYLTDPVLPGPVEQALALTAAPGSVSGAVLLGAV
ncbi:beta-ketoacyl-[acyl-carrier-protein] synthase family protein [Nonomuraea ferruginea]|uniref:Beta-ketoacyl-[acyl-carrier-protein] synthase family protein n=1 Tax=Nonomuraea ferruginea TaxID=46174 RepID=A0ABT4TA84_9ACTN|nr:beta-ketoacyl-[acyl-carrier-protein] synthase family protein [Nonomuraea ferruginea]MDA0646412.1 beta-ketoacyl-[acyl-carrier-protein] synthase family protein [Nonomuraea ferruginea]